MTRSSNAAWLVLLGALLGAPACRSAPLPAAADPLAAPAIAWRTAPSAAGTWQVSWRPELEPIPFGEPCALEVRVLGADGGAAPADLQLRVDAGMPAHGHGTLRRAQVIGLDPGRFRVEGLYLHMPGSWSLFLDVGRAGVFERAGFEFEAD